MSRYQEKHLNSDINSIGSNRQENKMIVNSSSKTPIESAEFSAVSKPKESFKSKSKASSVSSMRGWLTKLKLPSGTKKFINLKICNNKREKVDNPMFLNKKYLLPSCLVKEREIQKNYTALKNGLDKLIHSILSKCDNERQNSAKSMCISNQCDLYVEDLRKEKFNECLELIQMLDDSICFNTKTNF